MRCNLTILFIVAAALVILVFAWVAATQGNGSSECDETHVQAQAGAGGCASCPATSWWE